MSPNLILDDELSAPVVPVVVAATPVNEAGVATAVALATTEAAQQIRLVELDRVHAHADPLRSAATAATGEREQGLKELAASIKCSGVLQPVLVRRRSAEHNDNDGYELIAGGRRLAAARLAGLTTVPVVVRTMSDQEAQETALVENLQREDLTLLDEAYGMRRLVDAFGLSVRGLARRLGKAKSFVAERVHLTCLPADLQALLRERPDTLVHSRELEKVEDPEQRAALIKETQAGLSLRDLRQKIRSFEIGQTTAQEAAAAAPSATSVQDAAAAFGQAPVGTGDAAVVTAVSERSDSVDTADRAADPLSLLAESVSAESIALQRAQEVITTARLLFRQIDKMLRDAQQGQISRRTTTRLTLSHGGGSAEPAASAASAAVPPVLTGEASAARGAVADEVRATMAVLQEVLDSLVSLDETFVVPAPETLEAVAA